VTQFAVAVEIITPDGVFTVLDSTKPEPRFKKFPGGKSEGEETPLECAVREVEEEMGISLTIYDLEEVYREQRKGHIFVFFQTEFLKTPQYKDRGVDGEEVSITPQSELPRILFPPHLAMFQRATNALP